MDFSSAFVDVRTKMIDIMGSEFCHEKNVPLCGRTAALLSAFGMDAERKVFGIMSTGASTHAHEYRVLFGAPDLTEREIGQWWNYALQMRDALVKPDAAHEFSVVSLLLVAKQMDKAAQKRLKKLSEELQYRAPQRGWSSVRVAVIALDDRKIYTNKMGAPLKKVFSAVL